MRRNFKFVLSLLITSQALWLTSCGPKAFTNGGYDDPNNVILLDDKFGTNDMQLISKKLIASLDDFAIKRWTDGKKPIVMVGRVRNNTSEHIDVQTLTDSVRTALIQSGRYRFADKGVRDEIDEELSYQQGKAVDQATAVSKGKQVGVQYLIVGDISSIVQEVGNDKVVDYVVTLNLTDLKQNLIEWSDKKEVRKRFRKKSVGF